MQRGRPDTEWRAIAQNRTAWFLICSSFAADAVVSSFVVSAAHHDHSVCCDAQVGLLAFPRSVPGSGDRTGRAGQNSGDPISLVPTPSIYVSWFAHHHPGIQEAPGLRQSSDFSSASPAGGARPRRGRTPDIYFWDSEQRGSWVEPQRLGERPATGRGWSHPRV